MDIMNKFVVPLIQMICSLLTLALWFQWRFNQGKWIQQTLRPCQRARAEEGLKTAGSALRLRAWVGVVVALDVAAVIFQWVFYVASVIDRDAQDYITMFMTDIKALPGSPFARLWTTLILFTTFNQSIWTAVGTSLLGPFAIREAHTRRTVPVWPVALLGFFLSLGPPYVMVGLVLGRLIASSTLCIVFSLSLCLAVGSLSAMLLFMLCHVKRRTADHASYDVDVVIEIKVEGRSCNHAAVLEQRQLHEDTTDLKHDCITETRH